MEKVIIQSDKGFCLTFHSKDHDECGLLERYCVTLNSPNLNATIQIEDCQYQEVPTKFFNSISKKWMGWKGAIEFNDFVSLSLSATSDSTGHIELSVTMRSDEYVPNWEAKTVLIIEAGQLDGISRSVSAFFKT